MKIIKVRNIEDDVIEDWTIDQILNEINRDRSGDWIPHNENDWREGWNEWVEGEFYSLSDEDGKLLTADESIEGQIISVARDIMKSDFMQYPDFDPSIPTYLCDALTIIVSQHLEDVGSHEIYDCLDKAELNNSITPELKKAFDHVKSFFPDLSIVVIDIFGKWNYMNADFKAFDFSSVDIDDSILEEGADSIQNTPFVYQEYENED